MSLNITGSISGGSITSHQFPNRTETLTATRTIDGDNARFAFSIAASDGRRVDHSIVVPRGSESAESNFSALVTEFEAAIERVASGLNA